MKKRGVVKKVLFYTALIIVAVIGIVLGAVYTYQDKIIGMFVTEANKHIRTKVEVEKISLSLYEKFPHVAVALDKVNVLESVPESKSSLGRAEKLYFTFSLFDLVRGKYNLRQVYVEQGELHVRVLKSGEVNYEIFTRDTTATVSSEDSEKREFSFNLDKVDLRKVGVSYTDERLNHIFEAYADQMTASLTLAADTIQMQTAGSAKVNRIAIGSREYFKEKNVDLQTLLTIHRQNKTITLQPSVVKIEEAAYQVGGTIGYGGATKFDLKLEGKNTNVQSLLSLLPQDVTRNYNQYRSEGDVYFDGLVQGELSEKQTPGISFNFGCRNASFYHPNIKQKVEKVSFSGSFTNGSRHNATTSAIELKNLTGRLNGRAISGNLSYLNFENPTIAFDVKGVLDVGFLLTMAKLSEIRGGSGLADVKLSYKGNLDAFKKSPASGAINTSGDVTLHQVSLSLKELPLPLTNLSGNFMFKRSDVAVSDFKGKLGKSDFVLNGMFRNIIAWLLVDKQRLLVEANLNSRLLDLDQLLSEKFNTPEEARAGEGSVVKVAAAPKASRGEAYKFVVSPHVAFDLSADIRNVKFRRFKGSNIKGRVELRNKVISSPNISFNAIGGSFAVRGALDARQRDHLKVTTETKLTNMQVDSLFFVFENFGQQFVQDHHLRGRLTAKIASELYFDSHLNSKTDLMQAEIAATVRDGQLINFAPMQKMSVFVNRSELANMRFSELHNNFWIQKRTIYIPEMDISSNLSSVPVVSVSGTHTFDQDMDYKIKLPLLQKRKADKDAVYGVVAADPNAGNSMLFLRLKGKEDNFKISYDEARVREKIKTDIKEEKQQLRDLLKGKKPKQKEEKKVELQQGEYFDF
ncbi:AsmA-like C-terminal region-containing protein [Pontibacter sp. 13R65]|uniref:AsmA family protein n=1 Tax=Pontibacter sp. 13R65 TaxID=3127458 RepID=UPI00301E0297